MTLDEIRVALTEKQAAISQLGADLVTLSDNLGEMPDTENLVEWTTQAARELEEAEDSLDRALHPEKYADDESPYEDDDESEDEPGEKVAVAGTSGGVAGY